MIEIPPYLLISLLDSNADEYSWHLGYYVPCQAEACVWVLVGWSPGSCQPLNIACIRYSAPPASLQIAAAVDDDEMMIISRRQQEQEPQPQQQHHHHHRNRSPIHLSSRKGISARTGTASGWLSNNLPPRCMAAGCSPVCGFRRCKLFGTTTLLPSNMHRS